ncbi:MAG: zinc-dependent metalloprotease, partial [Nocardioidaceae bacterium]|nr:zinc-dependent metalloprotease [Nocardioidaceae bacterium]
MSPSSSMVDWEVAASLGARLAGDGPAVSAGEAAAVVAELRAGAERSTGLVRDYTGLVAEERTAPVLVVDRAGWVRANTQGFQAIIDPLVTKLSEKKGPPTGLAKAIGSRVTGAEIGLVLGFLGSKVLGQFDPFFEPDGRLLLVAPNIVTVERELQADPTDFRLWVCLHE